MNTIQKITEKYKLNITGSSKMPVEIPNLVRNELGALFLDLDFKVGAEIGTYEGAYAEQLFLSHPNLKLFCVDPWRCVDGYSDYLNSTLKRAKEITKNRLSKHNSIIIEKTSEEAISDFGDESLDFVYLDGDHRLEHVITDISMWIKKVRVGGILCGHDFIELRQAKKHHVVQAVTAYARSYSIYPWFVTGCKDEDPNNLSDRYRSWMFIKQ